MKKTICLLVTLSALRGLAATHGDEGPQAAPPATSPVIASTSIFGGMPRPGEPSAESVEVHSNGEIISVVRINGQNQTSLIATLAADKLKTLQQWVDQVQPGALYDSNPSIPGCQDAPSTTETVYRAGAQIVIGESDNCKELSRQNDSYTDEKIIAVLRGLMQLRTLVP